MLALKCHSQTNLGNIHLEWNYPSNTICQDLSNGNVDWFNIRATNSLGSPAANWKVVYGQPWTNIVTTNFDGTNFTFYIPMMVNPAGQMFFVATSSNFWGESGFSNTSSTPVLPSMVVPQIFRN